MLEISVHHGQIWRHGAAHSFNARRGQTVSSDSFQQPDIASFSCQGCHYLSGVITRFVIDKDDLPCFSGEAGLKFLQERPYIFCLI
jgi:hypothetical protein